MSGATVHIEGVDVTEHVAAVVFAVEVVPELSVEVPDTAELLAAGWRWWLHNLVAHPLLVLWPRAGRWLHEATL